MHVGYNLLRVDWKGPINWKNWFFLCNCIPENVEVLRNAGNSIKFVYNIMTISHCIIMPISHCIIMTISHCISHTTNFFWFTSYWLKQLCCILYEVSNRITITVTQLNNTSMSILRATTWKEVKKTVLKKNYI